MAGGSNSFNHPVIEKLLEVKWERFGFKLYAVIQCWYTIMLIAFTIGFVSYGTECGRGFEALRMFVGAMAAATLLLQTLVLAYQLYTGQCSRTIISVRSTRLFSIPVPRFLMNPWNAARYGSSAMLIANAFVSSCHHSDKAFEVIDVRGEMKGIQVLLLNHVLNPQPPQPEFRARALFCEAAPDIVTSCRVPLIVGRHDAHPRVYSQVLGAVTAIFIWLQLIQVLILSERMAAFTYTVSAS